MEQRDMPLDTNLLYGEMAASWIAHLAIPFGASMVIRSVLNTSDYKIIAFIGLCVALSFVCQFGFLTFLQSASCGGVKNYTQVAKGAFIAMLITVGAIAIPVYIESMRLVVSQLFGSHKMLMTPEMAREHAQIVSASEQFAPAVQKGGAALSYQEYDDQTFQEIAIGASYWSAFAGAYGIGIGSLFGAKCSATD